MTGVSQDGIFVAVFFGAFAVVTIGEVYWLTRQLGVAMKKALTVVFLPNFGTITLGFFVTFVIFGLLLASAGDDADPSTYRVGTVAAFVAALSFPLLLMIAVRRALVAGLRIEQIERPLQYAAISTLVFFAAVLALPVLLLAALR